jgi:DNA repair protein RecO
VPARAEHDDALVLRSVDYGEADRIVTLLTRRHGKLAALARSARKSKRRFAGALEGFALLDAELAIGSGDLSHLQSARVTRAFPRLLGDLERLSAAGALLRLCRDLLPERSPDAEVFDALVSMLEALDRADVPPAALQVAFEIRLLALTGFAPLLAACGRCGKWQHHLSVVRRRGPAFARFGPRAFDRSHGWQGHRRRTAAVAGRRTGRSTQIARELRRASIAAHAVVSSV